MKKSIIKRRKRVVPFLHDQLQAPERSSHSVAMSTSPEISPRALPEQHEPFPSPMFGDSPNYDHKSREQLERLRFDPMPVDFTDYQASPEAAQNPSRAESHHPASETFAIQALKSPRRSSPPEHGRKRSFSVAEGTHIELLPNAKPSTSRLSSISSILNPPQHQRHQQELRIGDDVPLDPNLALATMQIQTASEPCEPLFHSARTHGLLKSAQTSGDWPPDQTELGISRQLPNGQDLERGEDRKARLQQEADDLRKMLRAKERELQELG